MFDSSVVVQGMSVCALECVDEAVSDGEPLAGNGGKIVC